VFSDVTRMMRKLTISAVCLLSMLSARVEVQAQQQVPSYRPNSPTLSPYLYLTRPNAGPFPNYQTFVQPLESQRTSNQIAQQQIIQLQQSQQQLQQSQQQEFAPTLAPTGVGATYNNTSHYYSAAPGKTSGKPARPSK
jgi:hypothetical protein